MNAVPEFDHHDPDYATGHRQLHAKLRKECPIVHTSAYGGFWVLTDYKAVSEVACDDERFTPDISLLIPSGDLDRLIPLQTDPPDLRIYRLALMPFSAPDAVEKMRQAIADDARTCVSATVAKGEAEVRIQLEKGIGHG